MNELFKALIVSGSLGALVGLERQWDEQVRDPEARVPAGARTFCLMALLGTLCAHFSQQLHPLTFAAGLLTLSVWMAAYIYSQRKDKPGSGLTTAASAAMVYLVGGLAYSKEWKISVMITVMVLILLAGKSAIHEFSKKFTKDDVRMALQFLAVSGVILPLVPDKTFGPYDAFNPRSIWLMVVIVSGLGFAGYVAVRALGQSLGIMLTGLAGGLASSTATTLSMSRLSRDQPHLAQDCALAIVLACTVMLWRINALVLVVSPPLAINLIPDMAAMSLPGLIYAAWYFFRPHQQSANPGSYRNPLSLKVAIQFAAIYALVVFAVKAASVHFGQAGILVASFISGLTDLDAIALSLSNLFKTGDVAIAFAGACIVLAAVANSVVKLALAWGVGERQLRGRVALLMGSTILIGIVLFLLRILSDSSALE